MTWLGEREFLILLLLNALAVVVYLLWCLILKVVFRRNTKSLWLKALVMLLCPVAGICFFLAGYLFYRLFFFVAVDLEDVVFSKDRIDPAMPAEEERESNMVPIEEALAVTDKDNLRNVMLDVVKGQGLLPAREQARYAGLMAELCGLLMEGDPARMTAKRFESVCTQLLQAKEYEKCRERCLQAYGEHPDELEPYACQLKLYFTMGDRDRFFRLLGELRASDVAIDSKTLEMVRVFL